MSRDKLNGTNIALATFITRNEEDAAKVKIRKDLLVKLFGMNALKRGQFFIREFTRMFANQIQFAQICGD